MENALEQVRNIAGALPNVGWFVPGQCWTLLGSHFPSPRRHRLYSNLGPASMLGSHAQMMTWTLPTAGP